MALSEVLYRTIELPGIALGARLCARAHPLVAIADVDRNYTGAHATMNREILPYLYLAAAIIVAITSITIITTLPVASLQVH